MRRRKRLVFHYIYYLSDVERLHVVGRRVLQRQWRQQERSISWKFSLLHKLFWMSLMSQNLGKPSRLFSKTNKNLMPITIVLLHALILFTKDDWIVDPTNGPMLSFDLLRLFQYLNYSGYQCRWLRLKIGIFWGKEVSLFIHFLQLWRAIPCDISNVIGYDWVDEKPCSCFN